MNRAEIGCVFDDGFWSILVEPTREHAHIRLFSRNQKVPVYNVVLRYWGGAHWVHYDSVETHTPWLQRLSFEKQLLRASKQKRFAA